MRARCVPCFSPVVALVGLSQGPLVAVRQGGWSRSRGLLRLTVMRSIPVLVLPLLAAASCARATPSTPERSGAAVDVSTVEPSPMTGPEPSVDGVNAEVIKFALSENEPIMRLSAANVGLA